MQINCFKFQNPNILFYKGKKTRGTILKDSTGRWRWKTSLNGSWVSVQTLSPDGKKSQKQQFLVQGGLWGIGQCSQSNYIALGPKKINLLPRETPSKIGVFLDYEMSDVSFYNLSARSLYF
jgi:tripartite motif-containing protein 60/61